MARPADLSQPRLAAGCRLRRDGEEDTLLAPETAFRLTETGKKILEYCDGQRTFLQIVDELAKQFNLSDPARIRDDAGKFLEGLQQKRVVDY